jgi:hypothetical protein
MKDNLAAGLGRLPDARQQLRELVGRGLKLSVDHQSELPCPLSR